MPSNKLMARNLTPPRFDAQQDPIIAGRNFGMVSVADTADPSVLRDLRFRRDVERLVHLGPRAVYEFLAEVGRERISRTYLEDRITDFASLDADALNALNAIELPAAPICEVSR